MRGAGAGVGGGAGASLLPLSQLDGLARKPVAECGAGGGYKYSSLRQ